ncbi:MAG TPA: large conductance mechanosensitive channel protein MscL [Myxococcales bacterium]|nr:large conductance mechanosensitive channel protein MscL [Myxococcales bacterium]
MNKTLQEFRAFLLKQNAVALAIGVIIGAAIGKVVSGFVEDVIMPLVGLVLPSGEWRTAQIGVVKYGDLAGRIVDFVIIAAVVFAITKALLREDKPAATKSCPECLEMVPLDARRCRACASPLTAATRSA